MSQAVLDAIQTKFPNAILESHAQVGDETAVLDPAQVLDVARFLKADPDMNFDMPIDATCVDYLTYPGHSGARFTVVYHLYSTKKKHRIRLRVPVEEDDPRVDSLRPVWRGVEWFEREVWDMYGVKFNGHPDLRRILMYDEFVGHPLRKDFPLRGYQPLVPIARLDRDNEDPKLAKVDLNPEVSTDD